MVEVTAIQTAEPRSQQNFTHKLEALRGATESSSITTGVWTGRSVPAIIGQPENLAQPVLLKRKAINGKNLDHTQSSLSLEPPLLEKGANPSNKVSSIIDDSDSATYDSESSFNRTKSSPNSTTTTNTTINTTTNTSDTLSENINQQRSTSTIQELKEPDLNQSGLEFVLFESNLNIDTSSEKRLGENINLKIGPLSSSENTELLQQQINDTTISADQRLQLKQQSSQRNFQSSEIRGSLETINERQELGYKLRALNDNISALETNPWFQAPKLLQSIHGSSLSNELVNETLNYFVNCGQRLSQMTKTYDDNDAYILLLQEKEVDLELAARIGQELLKQNKELKSSIGALEDELSRRQDDVQQLKHELASKVSLLDTFIEEEEQQNSTVESDDEFVLKKHDHISKPIASTSQSNNKQPPTPLSYPNNDDDCHNGFSSLNYSHLKPSTSFVEPFSSLPHQVNDSSFDESKQPSIRGESVIDDAKSIDQHGLVQTVTFQLVESNKRLCELQDELFYKGEQNLMQQEKIYQLQEQLRESDRRLSGVINENESLHKSVSASNDCQRELSDELKICKQNFSELLSVFLELQKESRMYRMKDIQQNSNSTFFGEIDPVNNISFDSFNDNSPNEVHNSSSYESFINNQSSASSRAGNNTGINIHGRSYSRSNTTNLSSSLHEELKESTIKNEVDDNNSDADATDEGYSGIHTNNISSPVTPSSNVLTETEDYEDASSGEEPPMEITSSGSSGIGNDDNHKRKWLGFSSFMFTTLLLLCLSVTFSSPANSNLAQKIQVKLDR